MKVLIIFAHPRQDSLTGQVKDSFEKGLVDAGHEVDTLDFHKIGWNPVFTEEDEPDYSSRSNQHYSEEVLKEQAKLLQYNAIAFAFPAYWWGYASHPKRVIKDKVKKLLWLTLTASDITRVYESHKFNNVLDNVYNVDVEEYCSRVVKFVDVSRPSEEKIKGFLDKTYKEGLDFSK